MDTNEKENAILPQNKAIVIIRRSVNLVMPMALAGKYLLLFSDNNFVYISMNQWLSKRVFIEALSGGINHAPTRFSNIPTSL